MSIVLVSDNEANRKLFQSICTLYENEKANAAGGEPFYDNISNDDTSIIAIDSVSPKSITFRISSRQSSSSQRGELRTYELAEVGDTENLRIGFDEDGATWFKKLRVGETLESPDSDWAGMRDRIAAAYHKKYYSVEYYINENIQQNSYQRECADFVYVIGELMKSDLGMDDRETVFDFDASKLSREMETYYRAKLRVDATLGVGQPMPLICYVYYRYDPKSNELSLMRRSVAEQIDYAIKTNISMNRGDKKEVGANDSDVTNRLIKIKLGEDFNGYNGVDKFNESRILTQECKEALSRGITAGASDTLNLDCKSIRLLSVAKVNWPTIRFNVRCASQDVFELNYNINGMTLTCINCSSMGMGGSILIENNYFKFPSSVTAKDSVCIYGNDENGNLDKDKERMKARLLSLRSDGSLNGCNLFSHLTAMPTCGRAESLGTVCRRFVCESEIIPYTDSQGGELRLCSSCPYAEIVYKDPYTLISRPTSDLFFNVLAGRMQPKSDGVECRKCGISTDNSKNGLCETCYKASHADTDEGLYKVYSCVLPARAKIGGKGTRRVCFENPRYLIFGIGDDLYKFDKLDLTDTGYIKPAVKIMDRS